MFESEAKIKTRHLLKHIEFLGQNASDKTVDGFYGTEKELIEKFTTDASDLIEHNEWGVGLESQLTNLYEIKFIIDQKAIDLAKDAILECKMEYKDWFFIEELLK